MKSPCRIDCSRGCIFMIGKYDVRLGNEAIGQAAVTREGLYYRICCNCRLSGKVVCKLVAKWDDTSENLGVLVPSGGEFCINTKIPVKRAGEGQVHFFITPRHEKLPETFIPIRAEEPFAYLSRLENAYLYRTENTVGIVIREDSASSPPGSDQNP